MVYNTVNFYESWFTPALFASTTKPLNASDILNVVYNALDEQVYGKTYQDEPDMYYGNGAKDKLMYLDNPTSKKHYQCCKNQYILYTEKLHEQIDLPVNAANFISNWVNK
eukprot:15064031-Ditylum_brightwellii.AAC.1